MSGLIRIQAVCHSDGIPERIFEKGCFEKNSLDNKKSLKKLLRRQRVEL